MAAYNMYKPFQNSFAGISPSDGTIDFYLRVGTLAADDRIMLDLGAGRAAWFEDDVCELRKSTRLMKGRCKKVIGADVDPIVMENRSVDHSILIENSRVPLADNTLDFIVADYVLEHIENPEEFVCEINRLLKPGGWFCARTPHKFNYVCLAARALSGSLEARVMKHAQPNRKEKDIFPKHYRMNTLGSIREHFNGWGNRSFLRRSDPAYYFNRRTVYSFMDFAHRILPATISGNLMIFVQKPEK